MFMKVKNFLLEKNHMGLVLIFKTNRTLTDKQVDKIMKKLEKNFVENFNAELR